MIYNLNFDICPPINQIIATVEFEKPLETPKEIQETVEKAKKKKSKAHISTEETQPFESASLEEPTTKTDVAAQKLVPTKEHPSLIESEQLPLERTVYHEEKKVIEELPTVEEIPLITEEAKSQEAPEIEQDVPGEKPKKKVIRKIKKKKTDDLDDITQKLLEQEIERPVLEKYERIELDLPKRAEILMEPELKALRPIKIIIKEQKAKQPIITEQVEQPMQIKLRKVVPTERKEVDRVKLPEFMLKAFAVEVPYSSEPIKPEISYLGSVRQNAEISRTESEERELKKRKIKKFKPKTEDKTELEEIEHVSSASESEEEPVEELKPKYERAPKKPEDEAPEEHSFKLGKGKPKPNEEEVVEEVKLKKIPDKPKETEVVEEVKPKKPQEPTETLEIKEKRKYPKLKPSEGLDFEPSEFPVRKPDSPEKEQPEIIEPEKTKPNYVRPEKPEHHPEVIEHLIVPGIPKKPEEPVPQDIQLKYKQKPLPEEEIPEIKLKPWTKPNEDEEKQKEVEYDLKLPKSDEQQPEEEEETFKPKKIKKIKKKKTDDLDEITQKLLEQEIERPELEQYEKVDVEIKKPEKVKETLERPSVPKEEIIPTSKEKPVSKVDKVEDSSITEEELEKKPRKEKKPKIIEEALVKQPKPLRKVSIKSEPEPRVEETIPQEGKKKFCENFRALADNAVPA